MSIDPNIDRRYGFSSGIGWKAPADVATVGNITLSGVQDIDGVTGAVNQPVLVWRQDDPVDNGIWLQQTSAWVRRVDADDTRDLTTGTRLAINYGDTYSQAIFRVTTPLPPSGVISPGEDAIYFEYDADLSRKTVIDTSADIDLTAADDLVYVAANAESDIVVVGLPFLADVPKGYSVTIGKIDSSANQVTVEAKAGDFIGPDLVSLFSLTYGGSAQEIISDGNTWIYGVGYSDLDPSDFVLAADKASTAQITAGTADKWIDAAGLGGLGLNGVAVDKTAVATAENAALLIPGLYRVASTITVSGTALGFGALLRVSVGGTGIEQVFSELAGYRQRRRYYNGSWSSLSAIRSEVFLGPVMASGAAVDLTSGIPSGTSSLQLTCLGVVASGTSNLLVQIGPSAGLVTSGYLGAYEVVQSGTSTNGTLLSTGVELTTRTATRVYSFDVNFEKVLGANTWKYEITSAFENYNASGSGFGSVGFVGDISRVRLTTVGGSDTFSAGYVYYKAVM